MGRFRVTKTYSNWPRFWGRFEDDPRALATYKRRPRGTPTGTQVAAQGHLARSTSTPPETLAGDALRHRRRALAGPLPGAPLPSPP